MGILWSKFYESPWRAINWGAKKELLSDVENYKPEGASHLRILLYGPVGVGKSSFINSAASIILGQPVSIAEPNACNDISSFTVKYKTHEIKFKNGKKLPVVFNDLMGLEPGKAGVRTEDIILAMRGHVKDGYQFKSDQALSEGDQSYNPKPSIDDRVHVLVCILNANATGIDPSVLQKMKEIREVARDLEIPQVAVVTHIDKVCDEIEKDIKKVFTSTVLKETMEQFSKTVGIPIHNTFPVRNNYEREKKDAADILILTALKPMLTYGDAFIDKMP